MRPRRTCLVIGTVVVQLVAAAVARAEVKTLANHNTGDGATPAFKFKDVPSPAKDDAGAKAKFRVIDGTLDTNGGQVEKLKDGKLPTEEDQPAENLFFDEGTDGGRIGVDLGAATAVKQVNTYSWHPNTRGPQVYKLYASDGSGEKFDAAPKRGADPEKSGWRLIAAVDTRSKSGDDGGQYGVSISDSAGSLGTYRYLLLDVSRTEDNDDFGNTFYSEIDVIAADAPGAGAGAGDTSKPATAPSAQTIELRGKFVTIDVTAAPDLHDWAQNKLLPVCDQWYPKIVQMLPSDGYVAPEHFNLQFSDRMSPRIPAATGRGGVTCNVAWFRRNRDGEAVGAVVHEMVHVVQQYGRARRTNPNATQNPGWMVEGIADYVRWFKYEPQSHGAVVRNPAEARYDASYRTTANFLDWVTERYDKELVAKMNAAMRQGKYTDDLWKQNTGKTADELGEEWKAALLKAQAATAPAR